jgi:class 3 adenylate cyclase
MGSSLRSVFLMVAATLTVVINVVGYALTIAYAAIMLLEVARIPGLAHSHVMLQVARWLSPSIHTVSSWFGWAWPRGSRLNFAPLILGVVALIATNIIAGLVSNTAAELRLKRRRYVSSTATAAPASQTLEIRRAETEKERAALLKRYRELEDALKSSARKECSFLSIDVVGSTQMKDGENPTAIAATFQAYEEMVKRTFESHGIWKSVWTPDGVMACFLDLQLAVRAGQQILVALPAFNAGQNRLKTPFKVRCGLNEGDVVIFEDSQLEKISDQAIDIAGHMQKYASENALQISESMYGKIEDRSGFALTGRDVDSLRTYEWKVVAAAGAPDVPVERGEVAFGNVANLAAKRVANIVGGRRGPR